MNRRNFVKALVAGAALVEAGRRSGAALAQETPQTAKDPNNMTPLEAHHVPKIELPTPNPKAGEDLSVAITVDHVMTPEHYIQSIEVFMDGKKVAACTLTPEAIKPALTVILTPKQSFELVVQERCNIHGLWENKKKIEVS